MAGFQVITEEYGNDTTHWSGSAPELLHGLYSGWRTEESYVNGMEAGGPLPRFV